MDNISAKLTQREIDCVQLASKGKSAKQIAKILYISQDTVKVHHRNIRQKLNCKTMIEAVVIAMIEGYILGLSNRKYSRPRRISKNGFAQDDTVSVAPAQALG